MYDVMLSNDGHGLSAKKAGGRRKGGMFGVMAFVFPSDRYV